jgi:hypothetical protein
MFTLCHPERKSQGEGVGTKKCPPKNDPSVRKNDAHKESSPEKLMSKSRV